MNEDATQQLLVTRVEHLVSIVEQIHERLQQIEEQLKQSNGRLDNLEKQQSELSSNLESLETKVDQRLRETRPIWENVLSQLAELHKEVDGLRAETASGFRAVDRKIGVVSKNMVDMTADLQELRGVIEKLESQPA